MKKVLIICSKFNKNICDKLLNIAQDKLLQSNMTYQSVRVPGAFEIPSALSICLSDRFAGYVLLGCVIRSETSHFDYVCKESCRGIAKITMQNKLAVGFGLITAENKSQAMLRSDPNNDQNYAKQAVLACIEMIKLKDEMMQ